MPNLYLILNFLFGLVEILLLEVYLVNPLLMVSRSLTVLVSIPRLVPHLDTTQSPCEVR